MKTLKYLLTIGALLTASTLGYGIGYPFSILFDFDEESAATIVDPAGAIDSVSELTGGVVDSDSIDAPVSPEGETIFSFDIGLDSDFLAAIYAIGYDLVFTSQESEVASTKPSQAQTRVKIGSFGYLGAQSLNSGTRARIALNPAINGFTGGTISVQVTGPAGQVELERLELSGSLSKAQPDAKFALNAIAVPDSSSSLLGAFALIGIVLLQGSTRRK